ncbi:MAG: ABC transporter permease subunit [Halobacteriaceae archaeon]
MGVRTVVRDDLRNARRSWVVTGVVGVLAGLVALIFLSEASIYDDPYRTVFDVSFFLFLVGPLVLAPLTYLAVAGDRASGRLRYVLGLPNSRAAYLAGTLASRLAIAAAAVLVAVAVGFAVAAATFTSPPAVERFVAFAAVSVLYAASVVGVYVGVSAVTASRSRAMVGVLGAYFLLVPFWFGFLPVVSLTNVLGALTDLVGVTLSAQTRDLIRSLSPATAYLVSTEVVYHGVLGGPYESINENFVAQPDYLHREVWFAVLVMAVWGVGSVLAGYAAFVRSELG